ncbi:uncharacterized protein [Littorina saxatilis]|uniref:Uncharacterized protein n=1 Tax=Littorina saxatilis TaxID=31220 RepID=A0AAN9B4G1_9CAEN
MTKVRLTVPQVNYSTHPSVASLNPNPISVFAGHIHKTAIEQDDFLARRRSRKEVMVDATVVVVTLVSVGMQLTGMFVPGWWTLPPDHRHHDDSESNGTTTYGLWTTIKCSDGDEKCTEIPIDTSKANAWLQVTQVFESGAVAFSVLALLCYVMTSVKDEREMFLLLRRLSVFLLAASAVAILIGMAVFLKKSAGLARYPQRTTAGGHLDWPIFFSMAAAVLSIIIAVAVGVRLRRDHVTELVVPTQ